MTTVRSIIISDTPTNLSTVYTNRSGASSAAVLKGVDIAGKADRRIANVVNETSTKWSYFGENIPTLNTPVPGGSTWGHSAPYPVQLSDNRVLIFWTTKYNHTGSADSYESFGGNTLHAQILEYQNGRYVAGPIVNISLPQSVFSTSQTLWSNVGNASSSYGHGNFQAIAISPTTVAFGYRIGSNFNLCKINIVDNYVDNGSFGALSLTTAWGTTAYPFRLVKMPGYDKVVVVGGTTGSGTAVQVFNVSTAASTRTITSASAIYQVASLTFSNHAVALAPLTKNPVNSTASGSGTYGMFTLAASQSSNTTLSLQNIGYDNSTETWTTYGTTATITLGTTTQSAIGGCVSTGTNVNGVIFCTTSGDTSNIINLRQTNYSQASSSAGVTTLQSSVTRGVHNVYNWGDERLVVLCTTGLAGFTSAGSSVTLIANTESTSATAYLPTWLPFNSRPIFSFYDPATVDTNRQAQLFAKESITSVTSFGTTTVFGNYVPWGHLRGNIHYDWSDRAQCWIVSQHGRLYALSVDGFILSETSILQLTGSATFNYTASIGALSVTPSGRICFATVYGYGFEPSYNTSTQWGSLVNAQYAGVTTPLTDPTGLNKITTMITPTDQAAFLPIQMVTFTDFFGIERGYLLSIRTVASPAICVSYFDGTTWTMLGNTGHATTTVGGWNNGFRPNFRWLPDQPPSLAFPEGLWRIIGGTGTSTSINQVNLAITTNPQNVRTGFSSLGSVTLLDNTASASRYGLGYAFSPNVTVAAFYNEQFARPETFYSTDRKLTVPWNRGFIQNTFSTAATWTIAAASKYGAAVAFMNSGNNNVAANVFVFDGNQPYTPLLFYTGNVAANVFTGGSVVLQRRDKHSMTIYANASFNTNVTQIGENDTVRFTLAIEDGANIFFPLGNNITNVSTSGIYRTTDNYFISPNANIKLRVESANAISTMLTVIEEA